MAIKDYRKKKWEQRWKNRRPDKTYVTIGDNWTHWRRQVCPHCGRKYYYFRMPMTREDVLFSLKEEANRGEIPCVTLRTLLGRMHEIKMGAWEAHIELCSGKYDMDKLDLDANGEPSREDQEDIMELSYRAGYFLDPKVVNKRKKRC